MLTTPALPGLTVVSHPLVQHKIAILRDQATPKKIFKELVDEIAMLMAYEATADLTLEPVEVDTPLETTIGHRVAGKKLTLVPILRAGLGMVDGILKLVPSARVGHIGLYRDHDTLEPVDYYFKVPSTRRTISSYSTPCSRPERQSAVPAQARRRETDPVPLPRRRAGRREAAA
jgi:uracil phosphoribosyltransferase